MAFGALLWIRRALISLAAALALWGVLATFVRSNPSMEETPIARVLGVAPIDARLATLSHRIAAGHGAASTDELVWVRRALTSRPLSALPFYIAAASADPAHRDHARVMMRIAIGRDPRFSPAILWEFDDRLKANDIPAATHALLQLVELNTREQRFVSMLAQLAAIPEARAIIMESLARGPIWRAGFLSALGGSGVDRGVAFEMFDAAGNSASPAANESAVNVRDRAAFIDSLLSRRDYERAYLAWTLWLPPGSQDATGYVFDSGFTGKDSLPPFGWNLTNGVGGAVAIDRNVGLSVDYSGANGSVLAKQTLLLPPGRYRAATDANFQSLGGDDTTALVWRVTCLPDARELARIAVPLLGKQQVAASAPFDIAADCSAQQLTLEVSSADFAKQLVGNIRSISIEATK